MTGRHWHERFETPVPTEHAMYERATEAGAFYRDLLGGRLPGVVEVARFGSPAGNQVLVFEVTGD